MYYGDLKKASSELFKVLKSACPGCIEENGMMAKAKRSDILVRIMTRWQLNGRP